MKLLWIGALLLVFASLATLVSNRQSGRLIDTSWASVSNVLADTQLGELQRSTRVYTGQILAWLPEPFREKFAAKTWQPLELMVLRCLVLCHVAPALLIALIPGFLEGSWARATQKSLVKMHSPMRFSLALATLGFTPVLALLWITAPVAVSATAVVITLGALAIVSSRNLIVHAPTHF